MSSFEFISSLDLLALVFYETGYKFDAHHQYLSQIGEKCTRYLDRILIN